jgi:hypothetical protein
VPTLPGHREEIEVLRLTLVAGRTGTWEWNAETGSVTADAVHQSLFGLAPQDQPQPDEVYWARILPEEIASGLETATATLKENREFQMGAVGIASWRGRALDSLSGTSQAR